MMNTISDNITVILFSALMIGLANIPLHTIHQYLKANSKHTISTRAKASAIINDIIAILGAIEAIYTIFDNSFDIRMQAAGLFIIAFIGFFKLIKYGEIHDAWVKSM